MDFNRQSIKSEIMNKLQKKKDNKELKSGKKKNNIYDIED